MASMDHINWVLYINQPGVIPFIDHSNVSLAYLYIMLCPYSTQLHRPAHPSPHYTELKLVHTTRQ